MPTVSVIIPVYNVERFIRAALESVLNQSYSDFEVLIIDDKSPDRSVAICETYDDPRIRIIRHEKNRGLAAARNTGIRHAVGDILGFLDSDDVWHPDKLKLHVAHLRKRSNVGISFCRSAFIDEHGVTNSCYQMPRLRNLEPGYYLCRNPIGNGSAPVIRRQVFTDIATTKVRDGKTFEVYFAEDLRQSEDIECWIRIALTTKWTIEGIPEALTFYRLNSSGLSANLHKQFESWEQVIEKTRSYAPAFVAKWEFVARAYQLRYLARQAIRLHDGETAVEFIDQALKASRKILWQEPSRTLLTIVAAYVLLHSPARWHAAIQAAGERLVGFVHGLRIGRNARARGI